MIRSRAANASTQPRAPAIANRGSISGLGDQKKQENERCKSDEVADSGCGFVPSVRRVLDIEQEPNKAGPPPEVTTTCCIASTDAAATAVHDSEHGSSNEQPHPISPEKVDCCSRTGTGGGGSEHATIASSFQQSSYAAHRPSPQESEATAPEATGGGKASTADVTALTATTDGDGSKEKIFQLEAEGESTSSLAVATTTYRDFPVTTATQTQTQTARSLEQQGFSPHVEQQGFAPHIEQQGFTPHIEQQEFTPHIEQQEFASYVQQQGFAPHGWPRAAAAIACSNCNGFEDEGDATSLAAAAPPCGETLSPLGQLSQPSAAATVAEGTRASFAPPLPPAGANSKPPETPPQTPAWPPSALPRTAPHSGAASRPTTPAMTSAARLVDENEEVTTGANATETPSAASTVCLPPRPPTSRADSGSSMPTPSAPWLVQEALSVKAAVDAAVRGAYCSSPGGIQVIGEVGGIDIGEDRAGIESDWNKKANGSVAAAATTAMALTDEAVGEVPRVMADLRAALGRGMSTSEAKAWVQALDRLGEGLDGEDAREGCLDARRNLAPPPGHSDPSLSPSTSAAPTVQVEPPRVVLSDPGPVSATVRERRTRFLSSSSLISETVVDQSSSPADGAGESFAAGVSAGGGRTASPVAPLDPVGRSVGDNDKATCDESDFGCSGGGGRGRGERVERKQETVREDAASAATCSSARHSADARGCTERRKTAAASGPEFSEEKPSYSSAFLTRSSETADRCGDVTVPEENEKEMRVALSLSAPVEVYGDAGCGGGGGGGVGGARRRERRNATKFPDDVIGKVPCLCADLNAALGRNVGLQEVKDCLRLLNNSGEGLHRQALLEGCLELLRRGAQRKTQPISSPGEIASSSPLRVPIITIGKAVGQPDGSLSRRSERVRAGIYWRSDNEQLRGSQRHPRPIIIADGRRRRIALSRSPSDGASETERVVATSVGTTITAPEAVGPAAVVGQEEASTAPARPKKRGRSPPSPDPSQRQTAGGPKNNARVDDCGGGSSCRNRVGGGARGEAVGATSLGTKTNVLGPASRNVSRTKTSGTSAALCVKDGYQHAPVPRRSRGLIPDSVIAKVPRLLVDMENVLGYRVSLDEAKARCRELDRCGEGLTPEELCDACVCVLLRRAIRRARRRANNRDGIDSISSIGKSRRRKNVKDNSKKQQDKDDRKQEQQQQNQEEQEEGGGVRGARATKRSSLSRKTKKKEELVVAVAAVGARPQSAKALPADNGSKTDSVTSHPSAEAASAESVPAESVCPESVCAESVCAESVCAESLSTESVPAESVPAKSVPAESLRAESVPAESVSSESVSAESASKESVPAEAESEETVSAEAVSAKDASEVASSAEEGSEEGSEDVSARGEPGDLLETRATNKDEGETEGDEEEERGREGRDVETEAETVDVPVKKKQRLEKKNLPESVLSKVPRLVTDLETFVGQPVSVSEAIERCQQLDRGGEGLTQQELCDACVSLILRSDDHIIDGGVNSNNSGLANGDPDRGEQPRHLKGGRVLGNVQDRGDFASLAEGARGLGGWGGGARSWCAGKTALMLRPAQDFGGPNGNVTPARQQLGPRDVPQGWSRLVGTSYDRPSIPGDQEYGVHDSMRSMPCRALEVEGANHDEMPECSSRWNGRCGIDLDDDEIGGSDSDARSLLRSKTESVDENGKEQVVVSRAAAAAAANRNSSNIARFADGDANNGGRNGGAECTASAAASYRRRIGTSTTSEVKPCREPLQCEVGEFAVFPTPSGSTAPFLLGKILEKRLVAQHHQIGSLPSSSTGGRERTEILVHWFTPKKKAFTRATTTPAARAGGRSDSDVSCGVDGTGKGGVSSTKAVKAASSYAVGGWSPVYLLCPTSKRLVRDTGSEDLAAAVLVFPRLLSSDALPASVRDAVIVGSHGRVAGE